MADRSSLEKRRHINRQIQSPLLFPQIPRMRYIRNMQMLSILLLEFLNGRQGIIFPGLDLDGGNVMAAADLAFCSQKINPSEKPDDPSDETGQQPPKDPSQNQTQKPDQKPSQSQGNSLQVTS